jgi:hypothetical protein
MDNTSGNGKVTSDRAAMIRQGMEQTKRRLTQSLATLETQITEKVQHAGTAVNATAEAVQDAVHSVGKAFDMERQFRRHPWLFVGGSMALGYVATELLRNGNSSQAPLTASTNGNAAHGACADTSEESNPSDRTYAANGATSTAQAAMASAGEVKNGVAHPNESSIGSELRRVAMGAFSGIAQDLVARSVPQVMEYFRHTPPTEHLSQERRLDSVSSENI